MVVFWRNIFRLPFWSARLRTEASDFAQSINLFLSQATGKAWSSSSVLPSAKSACGFTLRRVNLERMIWQEHNSVVSVSTYEKLSFKSQLLWITQYCIWVETFGQFCYAPSWLRIQFIPLFRASSSFTCCIEFCSSILRNSVLAAKCPRRFPTHRNRFMTMCMKVFPFSMVGKISIRVE